MSQKLIFIIIGVVALIAAGFFAASRFSSLQLRNAELPPPSAITSPVPATGTVTNGLIAVAYEDANGRNQIFTVSQDGTTRRQLTNDNDNNWMPAWSPDGKKIAYATQSSSGMVIHTMNADGTNNQAISEIQNAVSMGPDWSPDGTKIAYASGIATPSGTQLKIWVMNADGSNKKQITAGTSDDNIPSWSPDGKHIAFTSNRENGKYRIWVVNADGSNLHALTTAGYDNAIGADILQKVPAWSPDGKYIAYWNGVELTELSQGLRFKGAAPTARDRAIMATWHIWLMDADGANQHMLTRGDDPAWSPDSKFVLFPAPAADGSTKEPVGVGAVNVDGTNRHSLFSTTGGPQRFYWQAVK